MKLEELEVHQLAMDIGEHVWRIVKKWDFFAKDTVGKQWVRAIDSVAANVSEGFGRFSYKENRRFGYYSRGSLYESKTWLRKARNRDLIDEDAYRSLSKQIETVGVKLNNYIRSIGESGKVREESEPYGYDSLDTDNDNQ